MNAKKAKALRRAAELDAINRQQQPVAHLDVRIKRGDGAGAGKTRILTPSRRYTYQKLKKAVR